MGHISNYIIDNLSKELKDFLEYLLEIRIQVEL